MHSALLGICCSTVVGAGHIIGVEYARIPATGILINDLQPITLGRSVYLMVNYR